MPNETDPEKPLSEEEPDETKKEDPEKQKEAEPDEAEPAPPPPPPPVSHWPIECDIANLNAQDNLAFLARLDKRRYFWNVPSPNEGGDQFLLTLTLAHGGVTPDVTPFNVELRYYVTQQGAQVTTGAFLFRPPSIATFRAQAPNNGDEIQQVTLQTIRFPAYRVPYGDATVSVYLFYHGVYVGKVANGIQVPASFVISAPK